MAWETEVKRVRGTARNSQALPRLAGTMPLLAGEPAVYVRFERSLYDSRAGREVHGKLYDSVEEAIAELGAKVVERVLRDHEEVSVTVSVTLPKWVEE